MIKKILFTGIFFIILLSAVFSFLPKNQKISDTRSQPSPIAPTITNSHSDLSYIEITASTPMHIQMINSANKAVGESSNQSISNISNPSVHISVQEYLYMQPEDGTYTVKIVSEPNADVDFYLYDIYGNSQIFHMRTKNTKTTNYQIFFSKEGHSSLKGL